MEPVTHVMVIGGNSWGKGSSAFEAMNNWQKNYGGLHGAKITVHLRAVSKEAYMDEIGNLYATRSVALPDVTITSKEFDKIWGGTDILNELLYPVVDIIYELEESKLED